MSGDSTVAAVPAELLKTKLESALEQRSGERRCVSAIERAPCKFQTSFALEQIEATLDDGATLRLMFKNLGEDGLSERARAAKPMFLYDPLREIEAYRDLLAPADLGNPAYHAAVVEAGEGRYWLFIENVPGVALWQIGELEIWEEAARWLARLHHHFGGTGS